MRTRQAILILCKLSKFDASVTHDSLIFIQMMQEETSKMTSMEKIVHDSKSVEDRLLNSLEIYNEEMSPTSVSVAYDSILEKVCLSLEIVSCGEAHLQRSAAERVTAQIGTARVRSAPPTSARPDYQGC
jgi:hypothetical protein